MLRLVCLALFCCCLGFVGAAKAAVPGLISDELDTTLYDCSLELLPTSTLSQKSAVRLTFEAGEGKNYTRLVVLKNMLILEAYKNGKRTDRAQIKCAVQPSRAYSLVLMRRGDWIGVLEQGTLIYRGRLPRAAGSEAGLVADAGWTVKEARVQRLEPVLFTDNFMRTQQEDSAHSLWTVQNGIWRLQSAWDTAPQGNTRRFTYAESGYAQNPFAWSGTAVDGQAFCTTGKPYWEDYTFSAAVRPAPEGAVGIAANMTDSRNGVLARWTPANDRSTRGNCLNLYKLVDGEQALLATSSGGYVPGQWYKLTIVSNLEGVSVLVDGEVRLSVKDITPWRGGVGLYTEGAGSTVFDDTAVFGRSINRALMEENLLSALTDRIRNDDKGMQEWATLKSDWALTQISPGDPTYGKETAYHRLDFYSDHRLAATIIPRISKAGKLLLCLNSSGRDLTSGYRAVIEHVSNPAKSTCTLYRDTKQVATKTLEPLETGTEYTVRLSRVGNTLQVALDGEPVVRYTDPKPLTGLRPAYYAEGNLTPVRKALVTGGNMLDYLFADAPTDWTNEGIWQPTTRWSCAPNWSFLAGWSRGNAVLWHKKRFMGDHTFEAFIGLKMEYPRERDIYDNRYRNFNITICGDGTNPLSGYTGIYGAPDETGAPNRRSILLRNGVEVGSAAITVPGRGAAHREWFDLALKKRNNVIEFWIEGRLAITYTDPKPIIGGVPAIWTHDNCLSMARARLLFANPPVPRHDQTVLIDTPWYPEWLNVGRPLELQFPETWSTTGHAVKLEIKPRMAPPIETGTAADVTVDRLVVTANPKVNGEYWYEITATDGMHHSQPHHLFGKAFTPALGRDDSRALVLYRFDEGKGDIVHDRSAIGKPLDITIPEGTLTSWVPEQGLTQQGIQPMMTVQSAEKLMAITQTKQATVEAWLSTDTVYPPTGWMGCIFTWEADQTRRNFAFGHQSTSLLFAPPSTPLVGGDQRNLVTQNFRTSLQHLVITWDGTITRSYINGVKQVEKGIAWQPEKWVKDYPLLVGNQVDLSRSYLGTYYLLAIHDRCLTAEDVKRHYDAGPSAR
ncbi:MAG: hypothetical protein BWY76_00635 [bacterium ADurb.Bin429]|nr:MAG: hypothetical protein BWY76_00635 [bacterium ADurb.Bin429]